MRRAPKLLAGRVLGAVACLLLFVGVTPARAAGSEGGYTEYTTPTPSSLPAGLTRGTDGALWFTENGSNALGRIDLQGNITEYPLQTPDSGPLGIAATADGSIWFTEASAGKIGHLSVVTPTSALTPTIAPGSSITYRTVEYQLADARSVPWAIVAAPDGTLWFTEHETSRIGHITPAGHITEIQLPQGRYPTGLTLGPDGALWFMENNGLHWAIGRLTPARRLREYRLVGLRSTAANITTGPDGNLWFTEGEADRVGRITPSGKITEFTLPVPGVTPTGIVAGPDGNLWFTEIDGGALGRISPRGRITEYPLGPTQGIWPNPDALTIGPDGMLWVTLPEADSIARLDPRHPPRALPPPRSPITTV